MTKFKLDVADKSQVFDRARPIRGKVSLRHHKDEALGPLHLTLHGQVSTQTFEYDGTQSEPSRDYFKTTHTILEKTSTVFNEPVISDHGRLREWTFEMQFPTTIDQPQGCPNHDFDGQTPPTVKERAPELPPTTFARIEYTIRAEVLMQNSGKLLRTARVPVRYRPLLQKGARMRQQTGAYQKTLVCRSMLLLRERAGGQLTLWEKFRSTLNKKNLPHWPFDMIMESPQFLTPGASFNVTLNVKRHATIDRGIVSPDSIVLTSLKFTLLIWTEAEAYSRDQDRISGVVSKCTTLKIQGDTVGDHLFNEAENWTKTFMLALPDTVVCSFSTHNIRRSYGVHVSGKCRCLNQVLRLPYMWNSLHIYPDIEADASPPKSDARAKSMPES